MATKEIKCDLMVIGAGLAGMAATLFAVNREIDTLQVGLASELKFASGLLDLLGIHPIESGHTWEDPWNGIEQLIQDIPRHPYARLETDLIRNAMKEFITFLENAGQPYEIKPSLNARIITAAGTIKITYGVPRTMVNGVEALARRAPCLLVDFHGLKGYSARQIIETIGDRWPKLRTMRISFPEMTGELYCEQLARSLETTEICNKMAYFIKEHLSTVKAVGLPSVLGVNRTIQVMENLEKVLGVPVFEIPTLVPSVAGLRIWEAFEQCIPKLGAQTFYQNKVLGIEKNRDGSFQVQVGVASPTISVRAGAVVLASGRFLGKGLRAERAGIVETIFDLQVFQPAHRNEWHSKDFFQRDGHPINRSGLEIDNHFRPVNEQQRPVYPNLYAVGSILAHQDWMREKCGSGLAIASAYGAINAYQKLSR